MAEVRFFDWEDKLIFVERDRRVGVVEDGILEWGRPSLSTAFFGVESSELAEEEAKEKYPDSYTIWKQEGQKDRESRAYTMDLIEQTIAGSRWRTRSWWDKAIRLSGGMLVALIFLGIIALSLG